MVNSCVHLRADLRHWVSQAGGYPLPISFIDLSRAQRRASASFNAWCHDLLLVTNQCAISCSKLERIFCLCSSDRTYRPSAGSLRTFVKCTSDCVNIAGATCWTKPRSQSLSATRSTRADSRAIQCWIYLAPDAMSLISTLLSSGSTCVTTKSLLPVWLSNSM